MVREVNAGDVVDMVYSLNGTFTTALKLPSWLSRV